MDWGKLDVTGLGSSLGGIFGGLFGGSDRPYKKAMDQYREWTERARQAEQPFYQAGTGAIPQYQEWLAGMKNPSDFINNLMGNYQESPWAQYQQDQAIRAAQAMGSARGLSGSTPLTQFAEQQAAGISSQDMQNWLQNVLGINTQYGQGQQNLITGGQNAANTLANLFNQMGGRMGEAAYGREAGRNQDYNNLWGGIFQTGASILPMFL